MKFYYHEVFKKNTKRLAKKYASLPNDLQTLENELKENPEKGVIVHNTREVRKIRMAIKAKSKGKSSGARILYYIIKENYDIVFLNIYDKSELEKVPEKDIKILLETFLETFSNEKM
jgi:mRNA-degrading endonuclease RelE of RelBE toxin-antitoxin system